MSVPLPPETGNEAYRPISGLALGGFLLSLIFAVLVMTSAAVALVKGVPIFFPLWTVLLAIAAFAMGYVAQNQIRASEGTRAGLPLARAAMGIALFTGLGYTAYSITVGMAVARQAENFLTGPAEPSSGFFAHLLQGGKNPADINIAFLLTRPATGRAKIRPDDDDAFRANYDQSTMDAGAGDLTRFRSNPLVRLLAKGSPECRVESLGVREWSYDQKSYKVARNYRIVTPEAILEIPIQAESTEAEVEGQHRQWFVNLLMSPILSKELTPLGKAVEELKSQGQNFLQSQWLPGLSRAAVPFPAAEKDKSDWVRLFPDSAETMRGGQNRHRLHYQKTFRSLFDGTAHERPFLALHHDSAAWPTWDRDAQGRFWMNHPLRLVLMGFAEMPALSAEGYVRLRTKNPIDPSELRAPMPNQEWDVEEIVVLRTRPAKGM